VSSDSPTQIDDNSKKSQRNIEGCMDDALKRSEERFRISLKNFPITIVELDCDLRFKWVYNPCVGLAAKDFIGKKVGETRAIKDITPLTELYTEVLTSGVAKHSEIQLKLTRGNKKVYYDVYAEPIRDNIGKVVGLTSVLSDITRRKQAEEALRFSEEKFSKLFKNGPSAMSLTRSNDGKIIDVNDLVNDVLGYTPKEVIGKTILELGIWANPAECTEFIKTLTTKGFIRNKDIVFQRKDGKPITVNLSSALIEIENEPYFLSSFIDITERKKAEDALRENEKDLALAQAVSKTGSWRVKIQGELYWSDETYRIFGVQKGTPMTYERFLSFIHPEDREFVNQEWQAALKGKPYDIEHRIIVDGKVKWVRETAQLEFEDGKLKGGFGTVQDITERKRNEDALKQAQAKLSEYATNLERLVEERTKQLQSAERLAAIGQTAGMVGHDIRNPLQAIVGDLFVLKSDVQSLHGVDKQSIIETIEDISANVEYINKIIADLQDYAKKPSPKIEEANLKGIIDKAFSTLKIPAGVQVDYNVGPNITIKTDVSYIRRVITNLTSNAIQAMPNGGTLTIKAKYENERRNVQITVADTGQGIPKELQNNLFKPLFTTKSKGQDFGLVVVKKFVEALNGTINFESEAGKGTKFTINLPT